MDIAIEVKNLSHSYHQGSPTLKDINLVVNRGEFMALVGQNGAGKTTLVKHIVGLLRPLAGQVLVQGQDVARVRVSQLASQVGFVFQNPDHQIFHDTVQKEVAFGLKNMGLPPTEINQRVAEALNSVGLSQLAGADPPSLSRGQRQRVALASVLAMQPGIIILDEPTTGQDYLERLQIMELIRDLNQRGHTVIFITHDMSLVAGFARRVVVLCDGQITIDGPVRQVMGQRDKLAQTLLEPPQITLLAYKLNQITPNSEVILTVDEMVDWLLKKREVG